METLFHSPFAAGAAAHEPDAPVELRTAYESMLGRLCRRTGLPEADEPRAREAQALELSGVPVAFRLEPWSGFVKIYADVGKPAPSCAFDVHRTLLEQQLCLPAPFQMTVGLDGESEHVILYACAPLSLASETDDGVLRMVEACVAGALLIRNALSVVAT